MPGTTLRLDEADHRMLRLLMVRTGKSQNTILVGLLRREFARYGISTKAIAAVMAAESDPVGDVEPEDIFWENERRSREVLEYISRVNARWAAEAAASGGGLEAVQAQG